MNIVSAVVVYLCIWWVVIFCVLPFGIKRSDAVPEDGVAGAPLDPKIKQKFIATTLISSVVFLIVLAMVHFEVFNFRDVAERAFDKDMQ